MRRLQLTYALGVVLLGFFALGSVPRTTDSTTPTSQGLDTALAEAVADVGGNQLADPAWNVDMPVDLDAQDHSEAVDVAAVKKISDNGPCVWGTWECHWEYGCCNSVPSGQQCDMCCYEVCQCVLS